MTVLVSLGIVATKREVLFNKPEGLLQQNLELSWSFRCDQIHSVPDIILITLWCYLSRTLLFNKPTSALACVLQTGVLYKALKPLKFRVIWAFPMDDEKTAFTTVALSFIHIWYGSEKIAVG